MAWNKHKNNCWYLKSISIILSMHNVLWWFYNAVVQWIDPIINQHRCASIKYKELNWNSSRSSVIQILWLPSANWVQGLSNLELMLESLEASAQQGKNSTTVFEIPQLELSYVKNINRAYKRETTWEPPKLPEQQKMAEGAQEARKFGKTKTISFTAEKNACSMAQFCFSAFSRILGSAKWPKCAVAAAASAGAVTAACRIALRVGRWNVSYYCNRDHGSIFLLSIDAFSTNFSADIERTDSRQCPSGHQTRKQVSTYYQNYV